MAFRTLVCIGDSLVEGEGDDACRDGWVGRIRERLPFHAGARSDGWRVFNLGIGGSTIADVEQRLGEVLSRNPDVVILGCGANDVPGTDARGTYVLGQYQQAWARVLHKLHVVVPQTMALFGFHAHTHVYAANWRHAYNDVFVGHEAKVMALCSCAGVPYIQADVAFADTDLLADGLHYNAKGYDKMADLVYKRLEHLKWI